MNNSIETKSFFQAKISNIIVNNKAFFFQFSFEHLFPILISVRKFYDKHKTVEDFQVNPKELEFIKDILTGSDKDLSIKQNGKPTKTYYEALANLTNSKELINELLNYKNEFKGSLDLVEAFTVVNPSMGWMINRGFRSNQKGIICALNALLIIINEINRINSIYN